MNNPSPKKRSFGVEGAKLLIGTGALVATVSLWSFFSNQDRLTSLTNSEPPAATYQTVSELSLSLPPVPTLVPVEWSSEQQASAGAPPLSVQDLRSVSAPVVAPANNNSPLVVTGSNRSNSGPVTSSRSS